MLANPDTTDPDADIIPRLMAGDEAALGVLIDRHMGRIHGLASRMLGDPAMAEDVAQTVFLKTWQKAPRWEMGKARLLTWMHKITTHACLDIIKKHKPIYTDTVPDIEDDSATALGHVIMDQRQVTVRRAIDALPGSQRAALVLSYYQGLSQKEGSAALEVSEKAYESLLSRARKGLKKTLGADHKAGLL